MKSLLLILACASCLTAAPWRTAYFFQPGSLSIANAPFSKYTHVIEYAIQPDATCGINDTAYQIAANYAAFVSAVHGAGAKALVSLFNDTSGANMALCTDSTHLAAFTTTVKTWAQSRGFDGIDFDWETAEDTTKFANLINSLRTAWSSGVLTMGAGLTDYIWLGVGSIYNKLDQINMMTYDLDAPNLAGTWATMSRHNHMLHQGGDSQAVTVDQYLALFTGAGVPASKLAIGIPYYGRIKTGQQSNCSSFIDGPEQPYCSGDAISNPRNAMGYASLLTSQYWAGTHLIDTPMGAQYIQYDNGASTAFVTFVGPEQIALDVSYLNANSLGGVMVFELEYEYIGSNSGDARYPLSTAIYNALVPTVAAGSKLSGSAALSGKASLN